MIFYFTGTGNSLDAAIQMAELTGDTMVSIADEMNKGKEAYEYAVEDGEAIGFIFPVYAWAPPKMVTDFINKLSIEKPEKHYTYSIFTCGDTIGNTVEVLNKALQKKGFHLDSGFTLIMPNNYIVMWDVDTKEKAKMRLEKAREELATISEVVINRKSNIFRLVRGPAPFIFTGIINPLFNKFAMGTKDFFAEDSCTGCGLCEDVCPTKNITVDGRPTWGPVCTKCLACIHRCPEKAIQHGKSTKKRGRYVNPCLLK